MKRMLLILALLLISASPAMAHGRFFFGINIGVPLFYDSFQAGYYSPPAPAYYYPPSPVVVIQRPYGQVIDRRHYYRGGPYYNRYDGRYDGYGERYYGRPVMVR